MAKRVLTALHWSWLAAMLATGVALRAANLHYPALFIDEAESAINAMTILQHGYPTDEYLGQPIFENTLVRPWPGEHPEYEFRDVSYSDRGIAIYHGWLPLYALAASYAAHGITPDGPSDPPRVQTTPAEMHRRTVAARVPSVVAGCLLILAAYAGARLMASRWNDDAARHAGLAAATIAAMAPPTVRIAREARYYAATHLLSLLACVSIWMMLRRGRWLDYLLGAVVFALLFHTHALSFAIACLVFAAASPFMRRHDRFYRKLGAFLAIVGLAVIPWALVTGFPGAAAELPAARSLLAFPEDYLAYPLRHWKLALVLAVGIGWLALLVLMSKRMPARLSEPFDPSRSAMMFLAAWLLIGYVAFLLLAPAPSAFMWRLTLPVHGPGIVFVAILITAAARVAGPRLAAALPVVMGLSMLALPQVRRPLAAPPEWNQPIYGAIDYLAACELAPGTRVYATPLSHLTLTLLAGMPVQSTAPVHRRFFEEHPGPIVILETAHRGRDISSEQVLQAAEKAGQAITPEAATGWAWRLSTRPLRMELADRGALPEPPVAPVPTFLAPLAERVMAESPRRDDQDGRWDNPAMFRGHEVADTWGFWQVFFYRFVDPAARTGENLNYATRIRGARATVLASSWVVIHADPPVNRDPGAVGLPDATRGAKSPADPDEIPGGGGP